MVLFFSANTTNPTYTVPGRLDPGRTPRQRQRHRRPGLHQGRDRRRPGSIVAGQSSAYAKSDMALAVYRGTDGTDPIARQRRGLDTATAAAHTSPTVNAPADSKWLVTYWADKSSGTSALDGTRRADRRSSQYGLAAVAT